MQKKLQVFKSDLFIVCLFLFQIFLLLLGDFFKINLEISAWLYFISGISIGIWVLVKFWNKQVQYRSADNVNRYKLGKLLITFGSLIAVACTIGFLQHKFAQYPLDAKLSDVIPTVQELTRRFANGEYVYKPIEKFGYHLPVTYLPMQWSPFLLAEYGGFDFRWLTIAVWLLSFVFLTYHSFKTNALWQHAVSLIIITISYIFITYYNTGIHIHTFELMIVGYYSFLLLAIQSNNAFFKGIIVAICLMSRYSLVLWLPVAVVVLWMNESRKHFFTITFTIIGFVLVVYVLPYLSKDWMIFYKGYKYYDASALGEWEHLNPATNKPYHLFNGLGFAHFIYQNFPDWVMEAKIKLLQRIHLLASLFTSFLLIVIYLKNRAKIHYKLFLLASFKIYIAVFLFFIQVPYLYLMLVDFFVGIALYTIQARYLVKEPQVVIDNA